MYDAAFLFVGAPLLLLLIAAVVVGVKRGVWRGVLTFVLGVMVLAGCWVALIVAYYANGGH